MISLAQSKLSNNKQSHQKGTQDLGISHLIPELENSHKAKLRIDNLAELFSNPSDSQKIYNKNSENELFSITVENLESAIATLSDNHWLVLEKLPPEHEVYKSHQIVKMAVTMLEGSKEYRILNDIILKQHRPTDIVPGTIGAFIFGCFQATYGDSDKVCSPLCMTSISGHAGACEHQVWMQEGSAGVSRFNKIKAAPDAKQAFIYVSDDFNGFYPNEIKNFARNNIVMAQVLKTKKSKHHTIARMAPLEKLPLKEGYRENMDSDDDPGNNSIENRIRNELRNITRPGSSKNIIAIGVIVVVIIILAIIFFWFSGSSSSGSSNGETSSGNPTTGSSVSRPATTG